MTHHDELHSNLHIHQILIDTAKIVTKAAREHPTPPDLAAIADEPAQSPSIHRSSSTKG